MVFVFVAKLLVALFERLPARSVVVEKVKKRNKIMTLVLLYLTGIKSGASLTKVSARLSQTLFLLQLVTQTLDVKAKHYM